MTEDEEGYEGARLDVTDEERLGFDGGMVPMKL